VIDPDQDAVERCLIPAQVLRDPAVDQHHLVECIVPLLEHADQGELHLFIDRHAVGVVAPDQDRDGVAEPDPPS